MQTILLYVTMVLSGVILQAQNTIDLTMNDFDSSKGNVLIGLYDSESNFLEKTYKGMTSKISDNKANITFTDIPDGVYAISCFHDEDSNGELNMYLGFYPAEAIGTSNDAPARFGPPSWEDAKFEVKNGEMVTLQIKM